MNTNNTYYLFLEEIRTYIPKNQIFTKYIHRLTYGNNASFYRFIPQIVIRAEIEREVSDIARTATKYDLPVVFRGSGTSLSGQASTDGILVLASKSWENYQVLNNGEKIRTQCGIIGARLNEILKPYGRKIGPDPASVGSATIGGIVANNASGMNGTGENAYLTIESARIIFSDGSLLDTASEQSRADFETSHPHFIPSLLGLRKRLIDNTALFERVKKKYSIKNTTGLGLNSLIDFSDPYDIILHLMVGSEGTLGFISELTLKTLPIPEFRASAMIYFEDIITACKAVQKLKGTSCPTAELLDRGALKSVQNNDGIPDFIKDFDEKVSAVLLQITADSKQKLEDNTQEIKIALKDVRTLLPIEFTSDPEKYGSYWKIRSGVFPSVGAMRKIGTSCIIEDVVFHIDSLVQATENLQKIIEKNGYEGVIYGHAIEGNFHFIINQDFSTPQEIERFDNLLKDVAELVVKKYDGSLKGEHGTGRNIAPYVAYEWGEEAFSIMKEIKELFDPKEIFGRGVIFNDDDKCHIKNLKTLSKINENVDKCIECGFCEPNCLTCGFTLSARERTVVQREIKRLENLGISPQLVRELKADYVYLGEKTCAKDGLCSISCPVKIDTGKLTADIRAANATFITRNIADFTANKFDFISSSAAVALKAVDFFHRLFGSETMNFLAKGARKISFGAIPLWTPYMPMGKNRPKINKVFKSDKKFVYFPSCINQVMGASQKDENKMPLTEVIRILSQRAGYELILPENLAKLCCGTIWESKGFPDVADKKSSELEKELIKASENGKYPIVFDQSPCLYRMLKFSKNSNLKIYDSSEFLLNFLAPNLNFKKTDEKIALHITCSIKKLGKEKTLIELAKKCTDNVLIPEEVGCCGFAGDRGFSYPEVNTYALRKLPKQLREHSCSSGYSNSRTCEIGLSSNGKIPYQGIAYLVEKVTR